MTSDFDYEFQIALTNRRLAEDIETVFLMPSEHVSFVSSSLLKEIASLNADISSFVPKAVERKLKERLNSMIKISVRDIPSKGLDIDQSIPKEDIGLSAEEVDIRSSLNVKAHLEKVDNFIIADTRIKAEFGYMCARCLEELYAH